jgi:hypothetical protein
MRRILLCGHVDLKALCSKAAVAAALAAVLGLGLMGGVTHVEAATRTYNEKK